MIYSTPIKSFETREESEKDEDFFYFYFMI